MCSAILQRASLLLILDAIVPCCPESSESTCGSHVAAKSSMPLLSCWGFALLLFHSTPPRQTHGQHRYSASAQLEFTSPQRAISAPTNSWLVAGRLVGRHGQEFRTVERPHLFPLLPFCPGQGHVVLGGGAARGEHDKDTMTELAGHACHRPIICDAKAQGFRAGFGACIRCRGKHCESEGAGFDLSYSNMSSGSSPGRAVPSRTPMRLAGMGMFFGLAPPGSDGLRGGMWASRLCQRERGQSHHPKHAATAVCENSRTCVSCRHGRRDEARGARKQLRDAVGIRCR